MRVVLWPCEILIDGSFFFCVDSPFYFPYTMFWFIVVHADCCSNDFLHPIFQIKRYFFLCNRKLYFFFLLCITFTIFIKCLEDFKFNVWKWNFVCELFYFLLLFIFIVHFHPFAVHLNTWKRVDVEFFWEICCLYMLFYNWCGIEKNISTSREEVWPFICVVLHVWFGLILLSLIE